MKKKVAENTDRNLLLREVIENSEELRSKIESIEKHRDIFERYHYASFKWITNAGLGILAFYVGFLIQLKLSEEAIPLFASICIGLPLLISIIIGVYFKHQETLKGMHRTNHIIKNDLDPSDDDKTIEIDEKNLKLKEEIDYFRALLPYYPNEKLFIAQFGLFFFSLGYFAIFLIFYLFL